MKIGAEGALALPDPEFGGSLMTCFDLTFFFAEGSSTVQRIRNEFAKGLSRKDSTTSSTATETTNMG